MASGVNPDSGRQCGDLAWRPRIHVLMIGTGADCIRGYCHHLRISPTEKPLFILGWASYRRHCPCVDIR